MLYETNGKPRPEVTSRDNEVIRAPLVEKYEVQYHHHKNFFNLQTRYKYNLGEQHA